MIHKPTQEQLAEQFKKIPVELRKAIASNTNADAIFEIGKKYDLLIDKTGELAAETGLLMLGVTHPNEFVGNLAERLEVDRATASKIADDINREIFAPVREHLRAMFGMPLTPTNETKPSPLQTHIHKQEFSEERLPKTGRLPSEIPTQAPTSLEDLEAELERALAEEKGIQPLSMIKKPMLPAKLAPPPEAPYKGADPYREQVEEDMPNTQGKEYVPSKPNQESEIMNQGNGKIPPNLPFEKGGNGRFGENSAFSPLREQKQTPPAQSNPLSAFRGFKMNSAQQEEKKDGQKESIM